MQQQPKHDKILVHVYYGTAGNIGLYMNQTLSALKTLDCDLMAFVNFYYLFDDPQCQKIFFKKTEFMPRNSLRKYIKFLEMIYDFTLVKRRIKGLSKCYKEIIVVNSLNECYLPVYWFIKNLVKMPKVKLGILVHDVIPFESSYTNIIYVPQSQILELANFFVSHNDYTTNILREKYPNAKVIQHKFPLIDLKLMINKVTEKELKEERITFLFLGFLRKEKGIEVLLDAWKTIESKYSQAYLIIAGKVPEGIDYDFSVCNRIELINKYLSDEEYGMLIQRADYGILPYIEGTNSGVLSTISCFGKPSVTSDLPMFKESEFTIPELFFESGNAKALGELVAKLIEKHNECYSSFLNIMDGKIKNYQKSFEREVASAYKEII